MMKRKLLVILILILTFISIILIDSDGSTTKVISYNGNNLRISIDGESSSTLPTSGTYYLVDYSCKNNNTKVTWDKSTYNLIVSNGSKKGSVSCYLEFKSEPLLSEMPVGSYVAYVGDSNNGCDGTNQVNGYTSCSGKNENYVSDTDMGYCDSSDYKFHVNGWRIGYIEKGSAYLVSAGAPECVSTYTDSKSTSPLTLSTNYYYGSGYDFDETTGKFSLTDVTSTPMKWSTGYQSIIDNTPYTCKSTSFADNTCTTMYEVVSFNSSTQGNVYLHSNFDQSAGASVHLANLNSKALRYCNSRYAKGGVCDLNTVWAMNAVDFSKITESTLSSSSCYNRFSAMNCGYANDLIDNGGYYWFATPYNTSSSSTFYWKPQNRSMQINSSVINYGVRPVLLLESSVYVIGGSGTYEDPYQIGNNSFGMANGSNYFNSNDNLSAISLSMNKSSDVSTMCISVDTSVCTNYVDFSDTYSLDMSSYNEGEYVIYVYYKDGSGNIVASIDRRIVFDFTAPTNNSISISEDTGFYRTLFLSSTGASKMCFSNTSDSASDCTNWVDYATTYNWTLSSGYGTKTVYAFFKDIAGNVSSVLSDSTIIEAPPSGITDYKYFMEVYNPNKIFLIRSDGATALVGVNDTASISWNGVGSGSMNTCTIDSSTASLNNYVWCIGNDNYVYYKPFSSSSWQSISIAGIDVSRYLYYISVFGNNNMYITRQDGKTNLVTNNNLVNPSWGFGASTKMLACTNIASGEVACFGADGKYYFRNEFNSTTPYMGGTISIPIVSADKIFIDVSVNDSVSALYYFNNKIYNSLFSVSATNISWIVSQIPGAGIKTCAAADSVGYNVCLAEDNYLYFKAQNLTNWTKGSLYVE